MRWMLLAVVMAGCSAPRAQIAEHPFPTDAGESSSGATPTLQPLSTPCVNDSGSPPAPISIAPASGWSAANGLAYWKDGFSVFHFRGALRKEGGGPIAFILPVGCRPGSARAFAVPELVSAYFGSATIAVTPDGSVGIGQTITSQPGSADYFLDGVSFIAEQ